MKEKRDHSRLVWTVGIGVPFLPSKYADYPGSNMEQEHDAVSHEYIIPDEVYIHKDLYINMYGAPCEGGGRQDGA